MELYEETYIRKVDWGEVVKNFFLILLIFVIL